MDLVLRRLDVKHAQSGLSSNAATRQRRAGRYVGCMERDLERHWGIGTHGSMDITVLELLPPDARCASC